MEVETIKKEVGMSWKTIKLGDVATFVNGYAFKPGDWSETGLEIIRIQNLTKGSAETNYFEGSIPEKYKVVKGDILISWSATLDIFVWEGSDAWLNQHIFKVVFDKVEINKNYFIYAIKNILGEMRKQVHGATMQHITKGKFDNLEIPLPPLTTQKRIAEILDAADSLRRKDQELLKKYDELAQVIFIDMFGDPVKNEKGWEVSALEDLCIDIVDCPHTTPNHTQEITDFPCIRTSEMKNRKISWGSMKYLNKEEYSKRVKRLIPEAGDIVYAREGTYGQAVLLPENYHFALGQRTMLLRPNSNLVSNEFLWYQINSDFVYRQAKRKNMGSTVGHVNVADVKKFDILVPPVQLQLKFTNAIINLISAESLFENQESDKLFDSLIQKAFNGELVL
jgi:type I restriction enzyme S subunit